ncbi:MAG: PAS domain-containing protein [Saprospiraceae bacterium]|nr:PAS domain-containing protein [Saprospiraceae bacterium]
MRMLESMTESVLITTADLEAPGPYIIYVNPAFEQMTGWSREEILGKNPRILQGPRTEFGIFLDMRTKLENGEVWTGRTINYRKDQSAFDMEWSITGIRDDERSIYQYLAVQKEVTHLVETERSLQRATEAAKRRSKEIEKANAKLNRLLSQQAKTLSLFAKYVPESIVKEALAREPDSRRVSEALEVGLLFCDVRRFTALIDGLSPDQVVYILDLYYTVMSEVITDYEGVIIQFVGDEIFVAFGAPLQIESPKMKAVRCAIQMITKLEEINHDLSERFGREMAVGIGINYGSVIAGTLGSDDKLSYSITGSEVVTAKRIESLTHGLTNAILIGESVYRDVRNAIESIAWGEVEIIGSTERKTVYQVLGLK